MTVEEIEIIVTAKVEEALKEFGKILPTMKTTIKQAQEELSNVDMSKLQKAVKQQMPLFKKQIQNLKKSIENNDISIKINNKDAEKQISQTQKQIDSLNKKINARKLKLDFVKQSANQMYINNNNNDGVKDNLGENAQYIKLCKQEKALNNEIQVYNKLLEDAKVKMVQLKQETSQAAIAQNKLSNFKINDKDVKRQIAQIQKQIDDLQEKISAKQLKLDFSRQSASQMYINNKNDDGSVKENLGENTRYIKLCEQEKALNSEIQIYNKLLESAKFKMAELKQQTLQTTTTQNKLSSFFGAFKQKTEQVKSSVASMKNSFNTMPKITQNITNNVKNIGTGLKNGLKHILKYATALFSLRGIYSILSSCANAWLSSQDLGAKQLSANIEYMKYAMGSALAPVIQFVTNLVYQLMKAIQSVAYALTGVNIFAKATASSMKNASGSAKQASKSLSGIHNEINNVSDNNGAGSGLTTPSMDLSKVDASMNNWIENIKAKLMSLFEPIQNSWNTYGQALIGSIKESLGEVKKLINEIGKSFKVVWSNGTGEETINIILQILTSIFNTIGNIHIAFANAWQNNGGTEIVQGLWNAFNNILDIILEVQKSFEQWTASESFQIFANSIIEICTTLSSWFEIITDKLKEIWNNGGNETFSKLLQFISKVLEAVDALISFLSPAIEFAVKLIGGAIETIIKVIGDILDSLGGLLDFITGIFTGNWEKAWNGIKDFFSGIWNALVDLVSGLGKQIWLYIEAVLNNIKDSWKRVWDWIKQKTEDIWNGIKEKIANVINGIKDNITNRLTIIKTIWSNIWNGLKTTATNIFNNIWSAIKNVINSILGGIEGMANGVVRGVNTVVRTLNKLKFNIPDWIPGIGGKTFGFNIGLMPEVSLPRLAKGNVAYDKTLAVFGEYAGASNNPEITTPQNIMRDTFEDVLSDFNGNNRQPLHVTIQYLGKNIFDDTIDYINAKTRRTGRNTIVTVGD